MTRRRHPLVVTGGQVWETTGQLVRDLVDGPGGPRPDLLVWDELDVDERWVGRRATFVVRARPIRRGLVERGRTSLGNRAGDLELRWHLRRRRTADVAMVGWVALGASPWLEGSQGLRAWLPTLDDRAALADGLGIPAAHDGGPHHVVVTDLELLRGEPLASEPRLRWEPGFWPTAPPDPPRPEVLAWGLPDRRHGIDLVGRALAARGAELRRAGAVVRWIAPPEAELSTDELDDLRRAGVDDLVHLHPDADPEGALRTRLPGAAALLLCGRPGASVPGDETLVHAYRHGVRVVAFDPPHAADLALDRRWTQPGFGDVTAVAEALVAAVRAPAPARLPGPVGLGALFRHLAATEPTGG